MINATGILPGIFGVVNVPKMSPVVVCKITGVSIKAESLSDAAITSILINKEKMAIIMDLIMMKIYGKTKLDIIVK